MWAGREVHIPAERRVREKESPSFDVIAVLFFGRRRGIVIVVIVVRVPIRENEHDLILLVQR